jgi:hypothetical protein
MTPSSIIYLWKEERPEKPVVATENEKKIDFTNENQS